MKKEKRKGSHLDRGKEMKKVRRKEIRQTFFFDTWTLEDGTGRLS